MLVLRRASRACGSTRTRRETCSRGRAGARGKLTANEDAALLLREDAVLEGVPSAVLEDGAGGRANLYSCVGLSSLEVVGPARWLVPLLVP